MVFDDAEQAKKRLEEAKARLKEEKRRLRDEMRSSKGQRSRKHHKDLQLQPWMIWDIGIVILMIILFSTAMYYPRPGVSAELTTEDSKEVNTTTDSGISGIVVEDTSGDVISANEETNETEKEPVDTRGAPDFALTLEDENGEVLEEISTTATSLKYNIVVKNLENDFLICNGDRTIEDDLDEDYYENLRLHPKEKEILPNVLIGSGRTEVKYEVECVFHDGTTTGKASAEFDTIFTKTTINTS